MLTEERLRQGFSIAHEGFTLPGLLAASTMIMVEVLTQYCPALYTAMDILLKR